MAGSSIGLDQRLQDYLLQVSLQEPEVCVRLREETGSLPEAGMISSPEQIQMLLLLLKLIDARSALEIGTFTGYTALRLTLGIPDLHITCCDISHEFTAVARRYWQQAGVKGRIDLKIAPASETLQAMMDEGHSESFDFAYIDADKSGYTNYVELCLALVRSGGLIAIDNVLWSGAVADDSDQQEDTLALRRLNESLLERAGKDFDLSLIPIGDGLSLLRKY